MAPNGPRNGNAPTGPRSTRSSTTGGKAGGRGGVGKRRAGGPTRIDRDGDLSMDAPAAANGVAPGRTNNKDSPAPSGRRSTRSSTAASRPPKPTTRAQQMVAKVIGSGAGSLAARISAGIDTSSRHRRSDRAINAADIKTLRVEGLTGSSAADNEGGGLKELVNFLERKASSVGKVGNRTVRIKKSQLKGDFVYITTSKDDAEEILKLNGFSFARSTLVIMETTEGMPGGGNQPTTSASTQELKALLTEFLGRRYDVNSKLLNLSNLGQDSVLGQMDVFKEATPEKLFSGLMAICDGLFTTPQAKRDSIASISLTGNNIDDVSQIWSLADTFPDLLNLDLSDNQFKDLKGLRKWANNKRLRKLETLLLNNNPIEMLTPHYATEVTSWFPRLQNLSGAQVRTPEQVAAAEKELIPTPIPQNGADLRDVNRVGETFITEFIQMYDLDRQALAAKYYDDQSTFSLAVNNSAPHAPDVQPPGWTNYIKFSRNHKKITTQGARHQRLFNGTGLIQGAWQKLPPTRHPDVATQFEKYMFDCHPINGLADPSGQNPNGVDGMVITVHGEFEDQDPDTKNTAKRSFTRTFVLGPGAPGRHIIRVITDMLSLKVYNPLPTSTPSSAPAPVAAPIAEPVSAESQQLQMVMALCERTGMTPDYSKMCLETASWNFDQALLSFNEKRGQLPPEAFVSAPTPGMMA